MEHMRNWWELSVRRINRVTDTPKAFFRGMASLRSSGMGSVFSKKCLPARWRFFGSRSIHETELRFYSKLLLKLEFLGIRRLFQSRWGDILRPGHESVFQVQRFKLWKFVNQKFRTWINRYLITFAIPRITLIWLLLNSKERLRLRDIY